MKNQPMPSTRHELFTQIARKHLFIETLEPRNRDHLDFHDVGVVGVQRALDEAYLAGLAELLSAAEALLEAKDNQMETLAEWRKLRKAIRQAKKRIALPKP
ncbi:MAG: hypothetical protein GC164_14060 [Phycisphaera sp.]|nr:hypothetical protein [Phycisphaera sp.]